MQVTVDYPYPTTLVTQPDATTLDFATNQHRQPVQFYGQVHDPLRLRAMLNALATVMNSDTRRGNQPSMHLDPIVTVHHDEIFFEAFSADGGSYARLSASQNAFTPQGEVRYGTTTVDFDWTLAETLGELRSSRPTFLALGHASGGLFPTRSARTVMVSQDQLKGFLQVQSALSLRNLYTFDVRPADLLSVISYIEEHRVYRQRQGLRYELRTDAPIAIVLEPWEQRFPLRQSVYNGFDRTVRVWGRKRLSLLRAMLPYAQRVIVGVLGRGLPHVYLCYCGPYRFLLALSGWSSNDWSVGSAFDLMAPISEGGQERVPRVAAYLNEHLAAPRERIVADTGLTSVEVEAALFDLCRAGRAMYDLGTRSYRLRELFAEPLDTAALFDNNPRLLAAQRLFADGKVQIESATENKKRNETNYGATVNVSDKVAYAVTASIAEDGRLRFGSCQCPFFEANSMMRGPCEHILATRLAADAAAASVPQPAAVTAPIDDEDDGDDE